MKSLEHSSYRPRYRFGAFALDPATRELRRSGELLSLSPKVFDGIAYLLENRDRAVGHDELTAAVWGRADVTDVQLRQLMRKIRRAVADDGEHQAVIRTIAHFGFHWTAETAVEDASLPLPRSEPEEFAPTAETPPVSDAPEVLARTARSHPTPGWRASTYAATIFALLALGSAAAIAWNHAYRSPGTDDVAFTKSTGATGVLPTEIDPQNDANTTWMRLGLMDFIASRLRKASMSVVASSDVVALSRGDASASDLATRIRHATGAGDIITSFASRQPNGWKVQLTLQRTDGREHAAEAHSPDALLAAREASDRLLALLGKNPPPPNETVPSAAELAQRVESALLVDDFATARGLIESASPSMRELPEMQLYLARIDSAVDKHDAARERLVKLLSKVSAQDDPVLRARALTRLAWLGTQDDNENSIREYSEAIELLAKMDEPTYLGTAYLGRAAGYTVARKFDAAKSDFAQARVMFTLTNDSIRLANVDNNEAALDGDYGRVAEALALFARAADTMERFGAVDKLIMPVRNQIRANLMLLQPAQALAIYQRMRPKLADVGSRKSLHFLDYLGAASLSSNGRLTEARALLTAVSDAADPKAESDLHAMIGGFLAELDLDDGKVGEAVRRAAGAIDDFASQHQFIDGQADTWLTLTRALRAAGNTSEAQSQTRQFAKLTSSDTLPADALRARLAEAEQYWSVGERALAQQTYAQAMQAAETSGTPCDVRIVAASYAATLFDSGDLQAASAVIGRVSRWASDDFDSALLQVRLYHTLGQPDAWHSALQTARALAGERPIPASMQTAPAVAALAQAQR